MRNFIPQWKKDEVKELIKELMHGDTWSVASHRSFRKHLTPIENLSMNRIISEANYDITIQPLREMDIASTPEEDFWGAVEEAGENEVLDFVFNKMLMSNTTTQ